MDELLAMIQLNLTHGVGARTAQRLIDTFGSAQEALGAGTHRLGRVQGVGEETASYIAETNSDDAERELEHAEAAGVQILSYRDPAYPANLKAIYNPPLVLYVRGELRPEDGFATAIVGTRRATRYGAKQAGRLAGGLAAAGCCIVSGLARGIDACAHRGCLDAGGRTIAVLGCGLDRIYPDEHRDLADEAAASGAVISEYPMAAPPAKYNFPRRNRVISGLALAVVIVEAGSRSGALITATWAVQQNREVMAVPGPIDSRSSIGCHRLIRDGAKLVTCPEDVLEEIRCQVSIPGRPVAPRAEARPIIPMTLSDDEQAVFDILATDAQHVDQIAAEAGMPVAAVLVTLMMLEMKKLAVQLPGKLFVREA